MTVAVDDHEFHDIQALHRHEMLSQASSFPRASGPSNQFINGARPLDWISNQNYPYHFELCDPFAGSLSQYNGTDVDWSEIDRLYDQNMTSPSDDEQTESIYFSDPGYDLDGYQSVNGSWSSDIGSSSSGNYHSWSSDAIEDDSMEIDEYELASEEFHFHTSDYSDEYFTDAYDSDSSDGDEEDFTEVHDGTGFVFFEPNRNQLYFNNFAS